MTAQEALRTIISEARLIAIASAARISSQSGAVMAQSAAADAARIDVFLGGAMLGTPAEASTH
jgi:hypothetical protein